MSNITRNLRDIVIAGLVAAAITFALGGIFIARADSAPALPGVKVCTEDDPCWTPLMGNGSGEMRCYVRTVDFRVVELSDCVPVALEVR